MIMKKSKLISFLRFGGVSEGDFNKVKASIAEENHKVWKFSSLALEVIFLIAFIITANFPDLRLYVPGYIILVVYFLVVEILLITVIKPHSVLFKPLIYVSSFVLLAVVMYQAFSASPDRNIGTYCAIIIAIAVLCIDRPYRFCLVILAATISFIVITLLIPNINASLYPDLYVGIVFGVISILICLYVNHIRIKDIVLRYNAEQERDIDNLTGMKNNNAYKRMVANLMEKARKADFEFTLVVFDVNGLKQTNDNYGHEWGDKLLSRAASLISESFPNGYIFRIGGDEFATFLTGEDHENRKAIIASFRKRVEDIHNGSSELKEDTSVACGYANYNPDVDRDFVSLFARADASMYNNKKNIKLKNNYLSEKSAK